MSVRTIYRDIDAISSAGIPINAAAGRNGGIQFLDGYVLNKSFFSDREKLTLLSSLQSLSAVQYPAAGPVLKKLGVMFQIGLTDWIDVDFSRWGSVAEHENRLFRLSRVKNLTITKHEDRYTVQRTLPENNWLYNFLMSFGDKVTIIQPESVRQALKAKHEAARDHHRGE